jgi:hypothetical protein
MRNSREGIIRQIVGERSFENVCCTSAGSFTISRQPQAHSVKIIQDYAPVKPHGVSRAYPNLSSTAENRHSYGSLPSRGLCRLHQQVRQIGQRPEKKHI